MSILLWLICISIGTFAGVVVGYVSGRQHSAQEIDDLYEVIYRGSQSQGIPHDRP